MEDELYSHRSEKIPLSGIRKMFELAKKPGIVNLTLGEPDFEPPKHVREAITKAVEEGHNKYTSSFGLPDLREAIAIRLAKFSKEVRGDNVIVTIGASEALFLAAYTFYDASDEVLIPDPGFVIYTPHALICRAKPVFYKCLAKNNFVPDTKELERLVTPKTKAIVVNSPNNPTGAVYDERTIKEIIRIARENNLVIISDEVYDEIIYNHRHYSFLGKYERLLYVNSFSKTYATTGWRLGYLVADEKTIKKMGAIHHSIVACPPSLTQMAAIDALIGGQDSVKGRLEKYRSRRDFIVSALNKTEGFNCPEPGGAFYAFPSFDFSMESTELALRMLDGGVAVVPGVAFGPSGEGHIRLSYATSMANLREAVKRIRAVAKDIVTEELKAKKREPSPLNGL